jgi:small subunit ribosomal protein S12
MPTMNQLINKKRISKKIKLKKTPALYSNPQKLGTCISVFTKTPRKPNSALRKVAKVRLVNSRIITVYIPGEGHNISRFSDVLISGRRIKDLPGVKYGILRGKFDLSCVKYKKNGRSKYGCKKEDKGEYILKEKKIRKINIKKRYFLSIFSKIYYYYTISNVKNLISYKFLYRYYCQSYFYFLVYGFFKFMQDIKINLYQDKKNLKYIVECSRKIGRMLSLDERIKTNYFPYKILNLNRKILTAKHLPSGRVYRYNI